MNLNLDEGRRIGFIRQAGKRCNGFGRPRGKRVLAEEVLSNNAHSPDISDVTKGDEEPQSPCPSGDAPASSFPEPSAFQPERPFDGTPLSNDQDRRTVDGIPPIPIPVATTANDASAGKSSEVA